MIKYEKYKDSGVEWIGEIPEHWGTKKLKYVANIVLGKMLTNSDKGDYKKRKYLRAANIEWLKLNADDIKEMWFSDEELKRLRLKTNDLLVSEGGEVGRTCIWKNELDECYIQNSVHKTTINSLNDPTFLLYQFYIYGQKGVFDSIVNRISIAHLTGEKIKEINFICPHLKEQTTIANYLDRKTAEIDDLIAKKEQLLTLYEEEKTAIINQAVTKGINPDGKDVMHRVSMKDSGIEWLGEIPEHWEVKKLKYVADLKSGSSITSEQIKESDDYPVYGGNGLRGYSSNYTHDGNHVLIGRQGALCGNINYAYNKFFASEHAVVATPLVSYELIWFGELLRTMDLNQYSVSAAQPGLSVGNIKVLEIPFPSLKEQTAIVNQIKKETTRINSKTEKTKKLIELQKEFRTALISEVVTGKIRVTNEN